MSSTTNERLIGRQQIADYLQRSTSTVDRLRREAALPVYPVGGILEAQTADLDRWIKWQKESTNG